jgi:putative colanic acid biosynthesis glycosyltransferase WcaI
VRFLILTQYFPPEIGAPQVRLAAFARHMRRLGHAVEVVTGMPNYPTGRMFPEYRRALYRQEQWEGIPVHRVWLYASMGAGVKRLVNYGSFAVTALLGLARARRPDYLFIESPPLLLSVPGLLAAKLWRTPVIFNVADLWPDSVRELGILKDGAVLRAAEWLERWTYARATYVNAMTEGIRATLIERKGVPLHKVLHLINGVDTETFRPGPAEPDLARELGWEGKRVFLYAGTLGLAQGLTVALDAMASLRDRAPEVLLAFFGDGSERQELETAARERGLPNVRFYGARPPEYIARLYRCAWAGFASLKDLPLFDGARPSKIFPAMASGKPVVYSGSGEGGRLIERAGAGLVVRPNDPAALAGAIARLSADPALAADLGARGRRFVEAELTWPALLTRWLEDLNAARDGAAGAARARPAIGPRTRASDTTTRPRAGTRPRPTPTPRVLHVIPGDPHGGRMIFAKRQVASLARAGVINETVYLASRGDPRALARDWLRIRRLVRGFRPDLIHAHYGTVTAMLCASVTLTPLVITYRGSDLNPDSRGMGPRVRGAIARLLSQTAALRAARIVCMSTALRGHLWWRAARVAVIPDGIDLAIFQPRPRDMVRRELGWPLEEQVVVFNVGNDPGTKRLDLAQAAFARARATRGDLRLELIDGNQPPTRIPLLLSASDCLLVTSDYEGSPNIVKEALACNLPVVSVSVGDVAERLAGVTPSRLVERSEAALADALLQVIALGRRCNGLPAVQGLSLDRTAERILTVYREVIGS